MKGKGRACDKWVTNKHYYGYCNKDGVTHTYERCPDRRDCLHCGERGHYTSKCQWPHALCTCYWCKVPFEHRYYSLGYPQVHGDFPYFPPTNTATQESVSADDIDQGEMLYENMDWEA